MNVLSGSAVVVFPILCPSYIMTITAANKKVNNNLLFYDKLLLTSVACDAKLPQRSLQYGRITPINTTTGSVGKGNEMNRTEPAIKYENTVPGTFVRRINRFAAEVLIDGKTEKVHVKNTGRLRELLLPGAKVTLQEVSDQNRKTAYNLISVYKEALEWVNIDSLVPNKLMKQYLMSQDFDLVRPEYTFGNSRFDFYMERQGEKYLTEVKGCTLAADQERGIGLFPDAPTERGVKHLDELAAAAKIGYHCQVAFVIQMNGIRTVLPNDKTQPEFGQALQRAAKAGVQIVSYGCHVEADSIKLKGEDEE